MRQRNIVKRMMKKETFINPVMENIHLGFQYILSM